MQLDPYHQWLGIPPQEQPPNHYRLLGLAVFESNPRVIESAADRQMAHVRTFQLSAHAAHSQKLLSEIAAARLVLLTPQRKAEYDERLLGELPMPNPLGGLALVDTSYGLPPTTVGGELPHEAGATPTGQILEAPLAPKPVKSLTKSRPAPSKTRTVMQIVQMVFGGVAGISIAILALWLAFRKDPFGLFTPAQPNGIPVASVSPEQRPSATTTDTPARPPQEEAQPVTGAAASGMIPRPPSPPTGFVPEQPARQRPGTQGPSASSTPPAVTATPNPGGMLPANVVPTFPEPKAVPAIARSPVPSGDALVQARNVVRDLYRGKYDAIVMLDAAAKNRSLEQLAREMSRTARDESDLAAKYACLEFAIRVGAMSGEADVLTDPFSQVLREYEVDETALRLDAYTRLAKILADQFAEMPTGHRYERFAARVTEAAQIAEKSGKTNEAMQLLQLVPQSMFAALGPATRLQIESRMAAMEKKSKSAELVRDLAARVEATPTNLELRTEYGTVLCFEMDDWAAGLPQLLAGSDPTLRELARKELEPAITPEQREQLGDAWWDYSLQGAHVESAQGRAAHWYRQMRQSARGLAKLKIEERLGAVAGAATPSRTSAPPTTSAASNQPRVPARPSRPARPGEQLVEVQLDLRKDSSLTPLSVPETTGSDDVQIEVLAVESPVATRFKADRATARIGTPVIIEFTDANNVWIELTATRNKRDEVTLRATPKCRFMNNQELAFTLNYLEERTGDIDRTIQTARNSAERAQRLAQSSQQLARSASNPVQRRNAEVTYQQQSKSYASQKQRLDQLQEMKKLLPSALEYAKKLHESVKLTVGVTVTGVANADPAAESSSVRPAESQGR